MDMRLLLPDEIPIARKSGELGCLNHEIAIVFGENTDYIFCYFSWNGADNNDTRQLMSDSSKIVYDFFENKYAKSVDIDALRLYNKSRT